MVNLHCSKVHLYVQSPLWSYQSPSPLPGKEQAGPGGSGQGRSTDYTLVSHMSLVSHV